MDRPLLTLARDLKRRKSRERRTLFVAEGVRAAHDVTASTLALRGVLATAAFAETPRGAAIVQALDARGVRTEIVTEAELASAADTDQPQGILVIAEIPSATFATLGAAMGPSARILLLDAVQDPGNTGALVRTAAALGAAAVVALPGTADLWNAKAVRGAAGALYRLPAIQAGLDETLDFLRTHAVPLWGTAADGEPIASAHAPERLAIAVGNEGAGLSAPVRAAAHRIVALPMASRVESLNVVVAAGIVLYALTR